MSTKHKKSQEKLVCMRGIHSDLWAQVRRTAKQEGYFVKEWVETALTHELAQARREVAEEIDRWRRP